MLGVKIPEGRLLIEGECGKWKSILFLLRSGD